MVLTLQDVHLTFGGAALLEGVTWVLARGERLCLLGRNGAGKSTLLRVAAGELEPDSGTVARPRECRVAYLGQEIPSGLSGTALGVALGAHDADHERQTERRVAAERALTQLGVALDADVATLSGGATRRVLLARALAEGADVLLLDEPTNHLDIETVLWLEEYLIRSTSGGVREPAALVFVTHDRAFARRVATRVAELDRGALFRFECGYDEFIARRDELLAAERQRWAQFDKRLAVEEAWLRRGTRARRTRDEGRVKALMAMRQRYAERRQRTGSATVGINTGGRGSDLVLEAIELSFSYPRRESEPLALITGLSTTILRGDRVGIVGPNGVGKTTLVRLLLGQLAPTSGRVRQGVGLEIVYIDQLRAAIDPAKTIFENVGAGYDTVRINGRVRHLNSYLEDFLFSSADARKPVAVLSGGERNRVLLATLLARPSNLLVLDEPTNDLDGDTLDLLEQALIDYQGTVLLVSHDREFLDNVVTSCLVLPGDGTVQEYVGGYSDWREREAARRRQAGATPKQVERPAAPVGQGLSRQDASGGQGTAASAPRKLSFKEVRELEALPAQIEALERELDKIHAEQADPALYRAADSAARARALADRGTALETAIAQGLERWQELEARADLP